MIGKATMDNLRINIINKVSGNRLGLAVGNVPDNEIRIYQSRFQHYLIASLYNEEHSFIAFLINYVIPQRSPYEKLLTWRGLECPIIKKLLKKDLNFSMILYHTLLIVNV